MRSRRFLTWFTFSILAQRSVSSRAQVAGSVGSSLRSPSRRQRGWYGCWLGPCENSKAFRTASFWAEPSATRSTVPCGGQVIDFLDFHLRGWHWPAFNIADMAIVVAAIALVLQSLMSVENYVTAKNSR